MGSKLRPPECDFCRASNTARKRCQRVMHAARARMRLVLFWPALLFPEPGTADRLPHDRIVERVEVALRIEGPELRRHEGSDGRWVVSGVGAEAFDRAGRRVANHVAPGVGGVIPLEYPSF